MLDKKRQTIMLVDDNQANLNIGKNMLKGHYEVYALPSAERLFKFLESVKPDLILLDIAMPGMNGFDVIRILKADARYMKIPVIFVTAKAEETDELVGLALGAVDYVTKPFSAAILLKRIENHLLLESHRNELKHLNENLVEMVKRKTAQISDLQSSMINTIAELIEFRDDTTGGHISRTQKYVELLIDALIRVCVYNFAVVHNDSGVFSRWNDVGQGNAKQDHSDQENENMRKLVFRFFSGHGDTSSDIVYWDSGCRSPLPRSATSTTSAGALSPSK